MDWFLFSSRVLCEDNRGCSKGCTVPMIAYVGWVPGESHVYWQLVMGGVTGEWSPGVALEMVVL